jgi:hypothetical protein
VAALSLRLVTPSAVAQDRAHPSDRTSLLHHWWVQFRVPISYMRPSPDPSYQYQHLNFAFWLSDGKPIGVGVPPIGTKARQGPGWYWPPEPGRPYLSKDDFLVFVAESHPHGRYSRRATARSASAFGEIVVRPPLWYGKMARLSRWRPTRQQNLLHAAPRRPRRQHVPAGLGRRPHVCR